MLQVNRGIALLLVVVCGLAGCTTGGKAPAAEGGAAANAAGQGSLSGLVVDDAVRPLPGANVSARLDGGWANTTTDAGGLFRLDGLQPGAYVVEVSKRFYVPQQQAIDVRAGNADPPITRFQLNFLASSVPYADLYKFEGLFECGAAVPGYSTGGCANINILTGIVFCSLSLPCFNVTGDRSVELIWINGPPTFLQSELVWEPTTPTSAAMAFGLGAATREELQDGFADSYNDTTGPSPLMLQLDGDLLKESRIGIEGRSLLIQVGGGWTIPIPVCSDVEPTCGVGATVEQSYTTYTYAFYGYKPPADWRFTDAGQAPPPPA